MGITFLETFFILENSLVLFLLFFVLRFFVFSIIERNFYAHQTKEVGVLLSDFGTMFFYALVTFPLALYISNTLVSSPLLFTGIDALPLLIKIVLYFLVADFFHYLIHRLMHTPLMWRIHMWHHTPSHMSWAMGFRSSLLDATAVNIAFILAWPLLGSVGESTRVLLLLTGLLLNDWMHLNVRFAFRFLGIFLVTPRYHHIHHSVSPEHHTKNLSSIFPIWDKLFGTYKNPDEVIHTLAFGLEEKRSLPRLVTGL